jgi:3-oxoacyl-[acyl-carrier protein] reductase
MRIDLTGKTALITGGNIGIGAGIARALADCGAIMALTYYSHKEAADETVAAIGEGKAYAFHLDATDSAAVNRVVPEAAAALGGKIDILVNNAGHMVRRVAVAEADDAHWHRVMDVNVSSAFYCTRAALPYIPDGGRIVNMSSLAARTGGGVGAVAYAAAKSAILGMTRGLAKELAPRRITVNALAPGFIVDTPFHETFTGLENYDNVISGIPLKSAGTPADVAAAVVYYVSDMGRWVTGQAAEINGGAWFV